MTSTPPGPDENPDGQDAPPPPPPSPSWGQQSDAPPDQQPGSGPQDYAQGSQGYDQGPARVTARVTGRGLRQPAYGQPAYGQPAYGQPAYGQQGYGQQGYHQPYNPYGPQSGAPYGVDPKSGRPYSEKQKLVAGLLQILLPLGIGRMYMGDVGLGVAQLVVTLVTCGIGALWPFIDGIIVLVGDPVDSDGRPLRS